MGEGKKECTSPLLGIAGVSPTSKIRIRRDRVLTSGQKTLHPGRVDTNCAFPTKLQVQVLYIYSPYSSYFDDYEGNIKQSIEESLPRTHYLITRIFPKTSSATNHSALNKEYSGPA